MNQASNVIQLFKTMPQASKVIYAVKNIRTGQIVAKYDDKNKARNAVDRKDNAYGACVHGVFEVPA